MTEVTPIHVLCHVHVKCHAEIRKLAHRGYADPLDPNAQKKNCDRLVCAISTQDITITLFAVS
jgi:hypothetical protein